MANKNFHDAERLERIKKSQRAALETLAEILDQKYLSAEKIKLQVLSGKNLDRLDLIDAVRENFRTALQFDDFRRAARYLATLEMLCQRSG